MTMEIRGPLELPARREDIELHTADGLTLVGELATPEAAVPVATLVTLHPLPTAGGFMDSHIIRKASARLPALADLAVLRFNTRGTTSPRGTSEGRSTAALQSSSTSRPPWTSSATARCRALARRVVVRDGTRPQVRCRPRHRGHHPPLAAAAPRDGGGGRRLGETGHRVVILVPEFDDYLRPAEARERFATIPQAQLIAVEGGKHLWVGRRRRAGCSPRSSPPSIRRRCRCRPTGRQRTDGEARPGHRSFMRGMSTCR